MTSAEGYHLVAHAVNVVSYSRVEVEWEVASQGVDGLWYTNSGDRVIPFYTIPIDQPVPTIPMGWVEHIQMLACKERAPTISLTEALGLNKPKAQPPIIRRLL